MSRKVYVRSVASISGRGDGIDYKSYLNPVEARRMSPLMKRAVVTSSDALSQAGTVCPDAIICGTGYGCLVNSETFLHSLVGLDDEALRPTHFMQSTHNTVSSMIAIRLKCHGYNATYSHRSLSFESALLDAYLQISSGHINNALVGGFEELTPSFAVLLSKLGLNPKSSEGELSETAVSIFLSSNAEGAICSLDDIVIARIFSQDGYNSNLASLTGKDTQGCKIVSRKDYECRYGANFCVSALGLADAVKSFDATAGSAIVFSNICPDQGYSLIKLSALCGN